MKALSIFVLAFLFASTTSRTFGEIGLLPRSALLVNADKSSVQISADGEEVGWLAVEPAGRKLMVRDLDSGRAEIQHVPGEIINWQWTRQPGLLLATTRTETNENLFAVSTKPSAAKPRLLINAPRIRVAATSAQELLVMASGGDSEATGMFRMGLDGGNRRKIAEADEHDSWWTDDTLKIVAARRPTEDGFAFDRKTTAGGWTPLFTAGLLDLIPCGIVSVSHDGRQISFMARDGSDTTSLFEYDFTNDEKRVVMRDPGADLLSIGATLNQKTGMPISVVSYRVRLQRHFLEESIREDIEALGKVRSGDVSVAGQSSDDSRWLVRWLDGGPAHYAVWERKSKRAFDLFDEAPGLDSKKLASRRPLIVKSRDGLDLHCDLYLPPEADKNRDGVPEEPLPAVIFIHGGPWLGFEWNFWPVNRNLQLLANRGYAVIRAGFRGENGYGSKYVDAGDREWGGAMHRDIVDVASAAVKSGVAARGRIAIWGWSYGGYEAAMGLALSPDLFACGIGMYGVYDLKAFLETPFAENPFWRRRVGNLSSAEDLARIRRVSPINTVKSISKPLLLTHGAEDDRVPIAQSDSFASALKKAGQPVTYLVFPNEGHDYARMETWRAFWAVAESFLQKHLHGAAEPAGSEAQQAAFELRTQPPRG
jgi:dipeptidyl aminopeptidase/acylaminoacyl peptidase